MAGRDPLEPLKGLYLEAARKDVSTLERLILGVVEEPTRWAASCAGMRRVTHDIMGQGAAFGYPLMTRVGQSLSHLLKVHDSLDDDVVELARDHVALLRAALDRSGDGASAESGESRAAGLERRVETLLGRSSSL